VSQFAAGAVVVQNNLTLSPFAFKLIGGHFLPSCFVVPSWFKKTQLKTETFSTNENSLSTVIYHLSTISLPCRRGSKNLTP